MRATVPALVAVAFGTACELPSLPRWDTEWELVPVLDTVSTAALLPSHVSFDGEGFAIDTFAVSSRVRLEDVCELCTCFDGPVPALDIAPHDWPVALPPGLVEAELTGGTARVILRNEVGFDLLDDGEGATGFLQVELLDRATGRTLQVERLEAAFPPGDSVVLDFALSGRRLHPQLVARVSGRTPGSGCRAVRPTEGAGFEARVELRDVRASHVDVLLTDAAVSIRDRSFALPGALGGRLRAGEAEMVVEVEIASSVAVAVEAGVSVARSNETLFTGAAALHTPLLLAAGELGRPTRVSERYVLDLAAVEGAERLHVEARNRILGNRRVRLTGGEVLAYRVRLLATIPVR